MVPRPLILLVDDDPYFTRTLTDILLLKGFVSECADQGKTAMDKARERPPSAALIDLKLPDMDGLMVMKEIKRHSPGTECIVLTGHASQSSAIEAVNMGAFSYVVKPYDIDQLLVILRRAVEKHQAEEALRESETRYRMLFNNGNDAVVVYPLLENDGAGRFIEVNDVACRELGYEREDLLSFTFSDIEAHAQRNNSPEIISRLFKEKHVLFETNLVCKYEGIIPVEVNSHLFIFKGSPTVLACARNVTERKRSEKIKDAFSALGYELGAVSTPREAASIILSAADKLLKWDASYIGFYSEEDHIVHYIIAMDVINDVRREVSMNPVKESSESFLRSLEERPYLILRDREDQETKVRLSPYGDVQRKSASLIFAPIRKGPQNYGVLSIQSYTPHAYTEKDLDLLQALADHCSGVLERTFAQSKLRQSEEKLRLLTEQMPSLLWTTDQDLRFTLLRGAGFHPLQIDPESLVGRSLFEFFQVQDRSFLPIATHLKALHGESAAYEMELRGKYFHSYVEPLRDAEGKIIGCISVSHDITERKIAEEELRKAHEIYPRAIENAKGVPYTVNLLNGTYEFLGQGWEGLLGIPPQSMTHEKMKQIVKEIVITNPNAPSNPLEYGRAFREGRLDKYTVDLKVVTPQGEIKWLTDCAIPLKDEKTQQIVGSLGILQDITERKYAEEALKKAHEELERRVEERTKELSRSNALLKKEILDRKRAEESLESSLSLLRATLESTADGILVVDNKGHIVNYNEKFIQMWNIPDFVIEGLHYDQAHRHIVNQLMHTQSFEERILNLATKPNASSFDLMDLKDGRIFECYSMPQKISRKTVGRVWSFRDVTSSKKAEESLARSEAIYREAIENASGVPYRLIYASGDYDFVGEGIKSLLGYPPEQFRVRILKNIIKEIVIADPDAPPDLIQYIEAFKRGEVDQYRVDLRMTALTGEEKWVSDCSVPIRDEKTGQVTGSLGILQDVTKRKRMEEETRKQQEQLVQTEKMAALGILVSGVAHEINNPNNFIMLNAPILTDAWQSITPILDDYYNQNGDFLVSGIYYSKMQSHVPELFNCILSGATRIKNIVQELRDFARESDARQMEWVDVNAVVKSSLTLLENMIKKSTDRFSVEYADPLPKIKGNFQRLEQVVINLIQNACQALENKEQEILVTTMYHKAEKKVILKVIDQGKGIPPEISKYIMNPFFTTKRESGGVGLGLSISSKIANEHQGRLILSSRQGKDTTAIVEIPVIETFDSSKGGGL